jgi:hypothetical protein
VPFARRLPAAEGYDTVLLGITVILHEEIERQRRAATIKPAGVSVQRLHEKYEKP